MTIKAITQNVGGLSNENIASSISFEEMLVIAGHKEAPDFEERIREHDIFFNIKDERYFVCRFLGKLQHVMGDGAKQAVVYFEYIRWMDEVVDNPEIDKNLKLEMLHRQHKIHDGSFPESPLENEKRIIDLQEKEFTSSDYFKNQVDMLLATFADDMEHQDLKPRTNREFRHYNYRVMLSISEILSHALNERPLGANSRLMTMFSSWNEIGHMLDIEGDMDDGKLQLELNFDEYRQIEEAEGVEEKEKEIRRILTEEKFEELKIGHIGLMNENISGIWDTDFELWQKGLSYVYLKFRAIPKAKRLVQHNSNGGYVHKFKKKCGKD